MEDLCERLRRMHGVDGYPVDVRELARRMGVRVSDREWTGRPHAVCVVEARLVILNARRSRESQRFDLAHELGHFVLPESAWHTELENRFAAALLMPRRVFMLELMVGGYAAHVAGMFGVGETAIKRRARELGWRG